MEPLPSFVISRAMAMGPYPTVPWLWSHGHMVATTLPGRSALTSRGYTWEQEILQTRIPQEVILVTYIYLYVYQVYEKVNVRMWQRILYVFYRIPQKAYKMVMDHIPTVFLYPA